MSNTPIVDNSKDRSEEVQTLIKRIKALIGQERGIIKQRYGRACEMAEDAVVNDFSIPAEDMQQRLFDYKRILWDEVYEPLYKEFSELNGKFQ